MRYLHLFIFACLSSNVVAQTLPDSSVKFIATNGSFYDTKIETLDTIPMYWSGGNFTLHSFTKKGVGGAIDTIFSYNHIEYVRQRVSKEMDHWQAAMNKCWSKYIKQHNDVVYRDYITAVRRLEYWDGVYNALSMVLYNPYSYERFDYDFKTKGIK